MGDKETLVKILNKILNREKTSSWDSLVVLGVHKRIMPAVERPDMKTSEELGNAALFLLTYISQASEDQGAASSSQNPAAPSSYHELPSFPG